MTRSLAVTTRLPSTSRVKARLEDVLGRLHEKLDQINGAEALLTPTPKATRLAQRAWSENELENPDAA